MKKIISTIIISIIMFFTLAMSVYGFENEIYKIDIPSNYKESTFRGSSAFAKSSDTGIIMMAIESNGFKKDLNTMSKSEIDELVGKLFNEKAEILSKGKEKLGKSKAIKARAKSTGGYMDIYITVSDKHVLLVSFMAPNETGLDSQEFMNIKDSFVMKEKTTNTTLIRVVIVLLLILGIAFRFSRGKGILNNIIGLIKGAS